MAQLLKENLLIAGSGKMALGIGDFFLSRGHRVTWVTENREQQQKLLRRIERTRKRHAEYFPENLEGYPADCRLLGGADLPEVDIVIESTSEDLEKKKRILSDIAERVGKSTIICSNSSSFLPWSLHPACVGTHFFNPVSLTPCVELIVSQRCREPVINAILTFLHRNQLAVVVEDQQSAFLANRLLLPLQSLCLSALKQGCAPSWVDNASVSQLLPVGQLSLMDSVGLDLMQIVVGQYQHLDTFGPVDFDLLQSHLQELVSSGKLGKKSGRGLLAGTGPSDIADDGKRCSEDLFLSLRQSLRLSCVRVLKSGYADYDQLRVICECAFHCRSFADAFNESCKDDKTVQL